MNPIEGRIKRSTRTSNKRKLVLAKQQTTKNKKSNVPDEKASVSQADVRDWFKEIYDHLKKENNLDVLENGDRIFNMDEIAFPLDPRSPVNYKNILSSLPSLI